MLISAAVSVEIDGVLEVSSDKSRSLNYYHSTSLISPHPTPHLSLTILILISKGSARGTGKAEA